MTKTRLFFEAIRDLFWPLSPGWLFQRSHETPVFAFLVHPRDITDVYRKYPFARVFSPRVLEWFLYYYWPVVLSEVEGLKSAKTGEPIEGWILSIPLTSEQMVANREKTIRLIRRSIKLAYCRGANIIGLGALNASMTFRGRDVKDVVERLDMGITSGVGYTAFNISDLAIILLEKFHCKVDETIFGVVGAAGAIGSATVRFLLTKGIRTFILIDLDRKHTRINELVRDLKNIFPGSSFRVTSKLLELKHCRVVISATNAPEALIKSEHLASGTIIIDDAQPSDIDPEVILKREDVLTIEGGVIEVKGVNPHFNFGLKHQTDVFSCLAEVMVLAAHCRTREQLFDYANPEDIEKIAAQGKELGFGRAEFQNFRRVYSEDDLKKFKQKYF
ncbi:MAG: hypothetical protein Q8R12_05015 [bacterium]|nr:hypothetical protein [bacterium]